MVLPGQAFRVSHAYAAMQDATGVESSIITNIRATLKETESVATGDGVTTNFTHTTAQDIVETSVTITDGTQVITDDGTYVEVENGNGELWAVHASGDGDFVSHRIRFEPIT